MTGPIEEAVDRLHPGYVFSDVQRVEIARNDQPVMTAKRLPGLVQSMAESFANDAPYAFDWRLVPVEWMLDAVEFDRALAGLRIDFEGMAQRVGRRRCFQMGHIAAKAAEWGADQEIDRVAHLYRKYQDRLPDHDGLMFWLESLHRARGNQQARSDIFDALVKGLKNAD